MVGSAGERVDDDAQLFLLDLWAP